MPVLHGRRIQPALDRPPGAVNRSSTAAAIGCRPWPSADDTHKIAGERPGGTSNGGRRGLSARTGAARATCWRMSASSSLGEPLDFLVYVSTLLAAVDPPGQNPFEHERRGGPERAH